MLLHLNIPIIISGYPQSSLEFSYTTLILANILSLLHLLLYVLLDVE